MKLFRWSAAVLSRSSPNRRAGPQATEARAAAEDSRAPHLSSYNK